MTADPFDPPGENAEAVRLLAAVPPVTPSADLFARILDRLSAADPPGFHFHSPVDAQFRPTGRPGVSVRMLHHDRAANRFSAYLRLDPGASLDTHTHDGAEECVVLSGSIRVSGRTLRAGDYQLAEPGSPHGEQTSDDGCILFLTGPLSLLGE
jgi:quercetin dioxygenase-like cupin family protein